MLLLLFLFIGLWSCIYRSIWHGWEFVCFIYCRWRGNGNNETQIIDLLWLFKLFTTTGLLVLIGALDPFIMKEFLSVYEP